MEARSILTILCAAQIIQICQSGLNDCCTRPDSYTIDCSGCKLKEIPVLANPNITTLRLNDNLLTTVPDFAFVHLKNLRFLTLRNNKLHNVSTHSFVGLPYLETLDITHTDGYEIPPRAFENLTALRTLKLGNLCSTSPCDFPNQVFAHVSPSLTFLELSPPRDLVFGKEFAHLDKLETLVLRHQPSGLYNVSSQTFVPFAKTLKTLEIPNCEVKNLDTNSFANFLKLETLSFACCRDLTLKGIFNAIKEMPSSTLTTLIIDGVTSGYGAIMNELREDWANSPRFENIKRLSIRYTKTVSCEIDFLLHFPKLEHLNIGYNSIIGYNISNPSKLASFLRNSNITSLDISHFGEAIIFENLHRRKYCKVDSYSDDFFRKPPPHSNVPYPLPRYNQTPMVTSDINTLVGHNFPSSLQFIYMNSLAAPNFKITQRSSIISDTNILFLDLSGNQITEAQGHIQGFSKLQGVDVSRNRLQYIRPDFFDTFPSLTYINASSNELYNVKWDRLLKHLTNLRTLDISSNRIEKIPENIFIGLGSLETALLNNNPLGNLFINLENNQNLTLLDLRNTSLLPSKRWMDQLDYLQGKIDHNLQIKLQGNIFQCDCNGVDFLKWLQSTAIDLVDKQALQCDYNTRITNISEVDLAELENSCKDKVQLLTVLLTPLVSMIAVLCLIVVVHRYRWMIKWKFYLLKRSIYYKRLNRPGNLINMDDMAVYDAFVSHHDECDFKWVKNDLIPKVEHEWGMKLCICQRDFIVGTPIAENICEAINKSRYIILVITPSFIRSEWCDFELHMALVKGLRHLAIIYKEEVEVDEMSKTLRSLLSSLNYIEYSETEAGQALFWTQLRDTLTAQIGQKQNSSLQQRAT